MFATIDRAGLWVVVEQPDVLALGKAAGGGLSW